MKNIFFIIIAVCLLGCEEDQLKFYHGVDNIYFYKRSAPASQAYVDTTVFSFAFINEADTLVSCPCAVRERSWILTRSFRVAVEGGTAEEGVNFDCFVG